MFSFIKCNDSHRLQIIKPEISQEVSSKSCLRPIFLDFSRYSPEAFTSVGKVKLAFKSACVKAFESRRGGSKFGSDLGSSINLWLTEEIVSLRLKRYNSEFFKSELAKATEAA